MKKLGLISKDTIAQFKAHRQTYNEDPIKNELLDGVISVFSIKRSLNRKGCPYDNAVAEATFKIFKTELVQGNNFENLCLLRQELVDYIKWFNDQRIHGLLNYLAPAEFRR